LANASLLGLESMLLQILKMVCTRILEQEAPEAQIAYYEKVSEDRDGESSPASTGMLLWMEACSTCNATTIAGAHL
jgi:hypothetical protein